MADISHTAPLADSLIPKGTWVEVRTIILHPSERAAAVPEDTAATLERHRAAGLVDDQSITTDIDNDIDLDDLSFDDED